MMNLRRAFFTLAVTAAFAAGAARGDTADQRLVGRLDPQTLATVTAFVDSARAESLPAELLVQRALEGSTKGAPPERITAAVGALLGRLRTARASLGDDASVAELSAGAAAIRAGVAPDVLARLRAAARETKPAAAEQSRLTVGLVVLADLVARGVPPNSASELIVELMDAGVRDADLIRMRQHVEKDIRSGMSPEQSAAFWARRTPAPHRMQPPDANPNQNQTEER
jgi:hypothetical protein